MRGLKRNPWLFGLGVLLAVLVVYGGHARADVSTNQPGTMIIFPKVVVDGTRDTLIQISNVDNMSASVECIFTNTRAACFLDPSVSCSLDLNCPVNSCGSGATCTGGACVGGASDGLPCTSAADCPNGCAVTTTTACTADTDCPDNWCQRSCDETNVTIPLLTRQQPTYWYASQGRQAAAEGLCVEGAKNGLPCWSASDCPGGKCAGGFSPGTIQGLTAPFVGELKCIEVDGSDPPNPVNQNSLKGEAMIASWDDTGAIVGELSEYNAIGVTSNVTGGPLELNVQSLCLGGSNANNPCTVAVECPNGSCTPLVCGGATATPGAPCLSDGDCGGTPQSCAPPVGYNACPAALYMNHSAEGETDTFTGATSNTELSLVPCTELTEIQPPSLVSRHAGALIYITDEMEVTHSCQYEFDCGANIPLSQVSIASGGTCDVNLGSFASGTLKTKIVPKDGKICYTGDNYCHTCTGVGDTACVNAGLPAGKFFCPSCGDDGDCPNFQTINGVSLGCRPWPGLLGVSEEFQTLGSGLPGSAAVDLHMEGTRAGDVVFRQEDWFPPPQD